MVLTSSTTALAAKHLLEEVELRRHCAQQGEEKREEELLTHCVLDRQDLWASEMRELYQVRKEALLSHEVGQEVNCSESIKASDAMAN